MILRKLDHGALPTKAPNTVYSGYGSGATCDACGDGIIRVQVEYDVGKKLQGLLERLLPIARAFDNEALQPRSCQEACK